VARRPHLSLINDICPARSNDNESATTPTTDLVAPDAVVSQQFVSQRFVSRQFVSQQFVSRQFVPAERRRVGANRPV